MLVSSRLSWRANASATKPASPACLLLASSSSLHRALSDASAYAQPCASHAEPFVHHRSRPLSPIIYDGPVQVLIGELVSNGKFMRGIMQKQADEVFDNRKGQEMRIHLIGRKLSARTLWFG